MKMCTVKSPALQQLVVLLTLSVLLCIIQPTNAKGIRVTVEASWNETSFLQEGCEWAGRTFGPTAFYHCVDALWNFELPHAGGDGGDSSVNAAAGHEAVSARYSTQQVQYSALRKLVQTVTEAQLADKALFEMEMASRVYSPAVEAHYAAARKTLSEVAALTSTTEEGANTLASLRSRCSCGEPFGVLYTRALSADGQMSAQQVCSAAGLKEVLAALQQHHDIAGTSSPASSAPLVSVHDVSLPRLDYRHPSLAVQKKVSAVFVLYGLLGSSVTREMHTAAVEWLESCEGALGTTSGAAATPTLAYFFRHLPVSRTRLCGPKTSQDVSEGNDRAAFLSEQWDTPLAVQGYGVTVDIKNMEYKVLDEKAAAQQRAKEEAERKDAASSNSSVTDLPPSGQTDVVVGGFHIQRLKERYPDLALPLSELATLMEDEVGTKDLKVDFGVWELQNLGHAAAQYIREVKNNSHRLHALKDLVNRFPLYAATLSRIATQPSRFEVVQKALDSVRARLPSGLSALFVDGWRVEEKDLSLFGVLDALRANEILSHHIKRSLTTRLIPRSKEEGVTGVIEGAGDVATVKVKPALLEEVSNYLKRSVGRKAHTHDASSTGGIALAIPDQYVMWLNDVEAEEELKDLPKKLSTLLTRTPGITAFPRRNLLNVIFIWNVLKVSHVQKLNTIFHFGSQGQVARYGVLLLDPEWSPEVAQEKITDAAGQAPGFGGKSSLSWDILTIASIAYHLDAAGKPEAFLKVLMGLLQASMTSQTKLSDVISSDTVQQVCREVADSMLGESLDDLISNVDFLNYYHGTQELIRRFPMDAHPTTLLNGMVLGPSVGQYTTVLHNELTQLRKWVTSGALRDDMENLYAQILLLRGAVDHLQPALFRPPKTMLWTTTQALVAFIESAPYLYSAAYAFDVSSLTQILALPCHATQATLQQLQTVLSALQSCGDVTNEGAAHYAVCRRLRVSIVLCPDAVASGSSTSASIAAVPTSPAALDHILALLQKMAQRDVKETKRFIAVQRYISHLLKALSTSPTVSKAYRRTGVLDHETVTAALAHDPLPDDLKTEKTGAAAYMSQRSGGGKDFWVALEDAAPVSDFSVTLVTNGRIVTMDSTFTDWDVLYAASQALPMARAVEEVVLVVNFAEMAPSSAGVASYSSDEMDNAFYSGKIACLTTVFEHEINTRVSSTPPSPLSQEKSLFASAEDQKRMRVLLFSLNNTPNGAAAPGEDDAAGEQGELHQITAVVDPSSRDAQPIVSIVSYLMQSPLKLRLKVLLNPSPAVMLPIRNFYEYVANAKVNFDPLSGRVVAPVATLAPLPKHLLLTIGAEEPPSWTVFSQEAEVDLDNILLSKLSPGIPFVSAVYRMHSILVTGDTTDVLTGNPPVGLPLSLIPAHGGRYSNDAYMRSTDTQVMANQNGYYQLQAAPGQWYLSVKPGPVAAAYCIEAVDTYSIPACAEGRREVNFSQGHHIPVVIDSFSGRHLSLRVRHTPLRSLAASAESGGNVEDLHEFLKKMAANVTYVWPPKWNSRGAQAHPPKKPTLNIFSVASGHLYERFLRMMFYSVHKTSSDKYGANTTRIKFWAIENFLSPQFKRYIPLLAAELGFEVGFVTYRWPLWLPRQTEKQRKIWAYKILFLDVLFPLDVDRIIFVDADQTAQADLHELYNMNIGRSPVAMTPFCQTHRNEDTARFRFWEHGFWAEHLKGKPYHISAIFLVDLRQFRAMLAGDIYRSVYASLADDPNSLANLDQDLPNYLQAKIPIFSLPEQWLWCETWCSADSKSAAKTIDLCNNPLTKMPKLDNAKMVIPGWEELDNKLQNMSDSLLGLYG
ncbi:hypothetical protein ABL78_4160 [Leptomonas seymouri]|uniref:UDP-glucose:glycoprotein glucosyltransferase n=1 Tax=Leptomonas seymouri TaxID=5684 RepID=A0A0N1PCB9_LEPSE|nr:hypothetical protein ABL78_4160 [Leptomonas seymouri]|eukprot:KPI86791.1 hypothetical protein ABL78_4160 [Leptomonas seymouri]